MNQHAIFSKISGRLKNVTFLIHQMDGHENTEHPQAIRIEFSNEVSLFIRCSSDGESLRFDEAGANFLERDMGEFGREIIKDFTARHPWSALKNRSIKNLIVMKSSNKEIGFGVDVENACVFVVNIGDDIFVFDEYPYQEFKDETVATEIHEIAGI